MVPVVWTAVVPVVPPLELLELSVFPVVVELPLVLDESVLPLEEGVPEEDEEEEGVAVEEEDDEPLEELEPPKLEPELDEPPLELEPELELEL